MADAKKEVKKEEKKDEVVSQPKETQGGKITLTIGPHGNVLKVDFTGVTAPFAAGGRTKNWLKVLQFEAKKHMAMQRANRIHAADAAKSAERK